MDELTDEMVEDYATRTGQRISTIAQFPNNDGWRIMASENS